MIHISAGPIVFVSVYLGNGPKGLAPLRTALREMMGCGLFLGAEDFSFGEPRLWFLQSLSNAVEILQFTGVSSGARIVIADIT